MKYLFLFFLFVSSSCYSQEKSIEVLLKSDSLIITKWIKLFDFPFLQQPFVRIHSAKGDKIRVRDIEYYKGYDQDGNYRYMKTVNLGYQKRYRFTERIFRQDSSQNVKIYFDYHTFGGTSMAFTSKSEGVNYSISHQPIKKVNYRNVKNDLADCKVSQKYINKAKRIRFIQLFSAGIGTALLAKTLWSITNPLNENFPNRVSEISFVASGALLVLPFTLERAKKKRLTDALREYK